jgi:uncharacterized protein (TIGR00369 family)
MNAREITEFLEQTWTGAGTVFDIEEVNHRGARLRMPLTPQRIRPGGIVSGPALMALADAAVWVALLGEIGPVAMAVTQSLTIHFLRPTPAGDVIAHTRLHKVGRRLATGDVLMYADGDADPVAHATVTYSIPSDAPRTDGGR